VLSFIRCHLNPSRHRCTVNVLSFECFGVCYFQEIHAHRENGVGGGSETSSSGRGTVSSGRGTAHSGDLGHPSSVAPVSLPSVASTKVSFLLLQYCFP
jgi:hypothetical protein